MAKINHKYDILNLWIYSYMAKINHNHEQCTIPSTDSLEIWILDKFAL